MNDALKLLSKSLQPLGYHLRKLNAPNILRLKKAENGNPTLKTFRGSINNQGPSPKNANLEKMVVYLRVCMRKNRNIDKTKRLGSDDPTETTLRCIKSLCHSINFAKEQGELKLIILDDRSDKECLKRLEELIEICECSHEICTTKEQGQGASLHEQFTRGKEEDAILYFVEDDYLHEEDAILSAWVFYKKIVLDYETHCLIYPQEHEILQRELYPSYIVASPDRHWRTINHATHTFFVHSQVVNHYWDYFENTKYVGIKKKRRLGSEAKTTNKLFNHIPGFSPIKPLAIHFQFKNLLPPYFNWKPLWEKNKL